MHIKFGKGSGSKGAPAEVKYYSAKSPGFYQISKEERDVDILCNTTTNPPDHVKSFSFKATGSSYSRLFNGTEKTLSWDNMLWFSRSISLPQ